MRLLISGGTGFFGKSLLSYFSNNNSNIEKIFLLSRNPTIIDNTFNQERIFSDQNTFNRERIPSDQNTDESNVVSGVKDWVRKEYIFDRTRSNSSN